MNRIQRTRPTPTGRLGRRLVAATLVLAAVSGITACAGQQEQRSAVNLCLRYEKLLASVEDVKASATGTPTADAVRRRAEVAQTRLNQLRAATDGQYDTLVSTLQTAINDLKQSAANAGAAAAQARSETLQQFSESVAPLKERLDAQCG